MANGLLSPVEQQTQAVFGMVPMEERLSLLPRYSKSQGLIAPQFIYDLAKAVSTPIVAMRGQQVSPEETLNTAISSFGGSAAGVAPKGSLRSGLSRSKEKAPSLIGTPLQRADEQGYIDYIHGAQRLDRLLEKKSFDPKRATSGPMPFGTTAEGRELASSYAMSKADTSLAAKDFGELKNYFQVSPKDIGASGRSPIAAENAWYYLPPSKKQEILDKAKRIGYQNPDEATGKWTLHKSSEGMPFSEQHWNFVLNKESGGNPLVALRKVYAESGMLDAYAPSELADIYRLAGLDVPISQINAPWTEAKGVFVGKARITNPLQTTDINSLQQNVIPFLKEEFKGDKTRKKQFGADMWDKNVRFTPKEWVNQLEADVAAGNNSYVWTSIPDKVTNALKKLGYNGIIDTSGKGGSVTQYPVVIPFDPGQIRSRFAQFDPAKIGQPDLLAMGGSPLPLGLLVGDNKEKKQEKKPKK